MTGLDTNILIRYLTQDHPEQPNIANRIIEDNISEDNKGYISLIVLTEIVWVLKSCYGQTKATLIGVIEQLLTTRELRVEQADIAIRALRNWQQNSGDFSDALIAASSENNGCSQTLTFDKKAVSLGMTLAI